MKFSATRVVSAVLVLGGCVGLISYGVPASACAVILGFYVLQLAHFERKK